ncbi:MAG: hypothetical protein EKK57_07855 [Proteobacteria bacterium]|nr:MAG: hypothetical protein EKK57_07855 [Pseudomonadota bacterium]
MMQTIDQLKTLQEIAKLLQEIKDNANAIWLLDGREYIKVQRGNDTIEIMVWYNGKEKNENNNLRF